MAFSEDLVQLPVAAVRYTETKRDNQGGKQDSGASTQYLGAFNLIYELWPWHFHEEEKD